METILAISGKPGLYRMVSRGNKNLIVESLDDKRRRMPAFATDRITSLSDIAMFTDGEDVALWKVLAAVGAKEENKVSSLDYRKCSAAELHEYFASVLPNYDRDRVHDSDIKKLIQWYNILIENGIIDFKATLAASEEEEAE